MTTVFHGVSIPSIDILGILTGSGVATLIEHVSQYHLKGVLSGNFHQAHLSAIFSRATQFVKLDSR